ncbi:hypothetical protein BJ742DRAFT_399000 [Cladochytrium replicatum]|nr:hypothetical protein BJ742DRAFT_399000 [Cladochytrium replicatum]
MYFLRNICSQSVPRTRERARLEMPTSFPLQAQKEASVAFLEQEENDPTPHDLSGNLEADYLYLCEHYSTLPMDVARRVSGRAVGDPQRYGYTPTIWVEIGSRIPIENDDDAERSATNAQDVVAAHVRGWKIRDGTLEALSLAVPACQTLTHITFWNCGLSESHIGPLLALAANAPPTLRALQIDYCPSLPEPFFGQLIAHLDDPLSSSNRIRILSFRGNNMRCAGARSIASALKKIGAQQQQQQQQQRSSLCAISLYDNRIEAGGCEAIAEAVRWNDRIATVGLGRNRVGDEGCVAFAKVLGNVGVGVEEVARWKKAAAAAEMERQKREMEEDSVLKKAKGRLGTTRNSSANREEALSRRDIALGNKKGGPPPAAASAGSANASNAGNPSGTAAGKGPKKDDQTRPGTIAGKKGAGAAPAPAVAAAADEKGKKKGTVGGAAAGAAGKAAGGNAGGAAAGGKKGKAEETREEVDEAMDTVAQLEPMFEYNNQWYVLGNRTLNSLDLSYNGITEIGAKAILDAVLEQENAPDPPPEGLMGLFRLSLQGNSLNKDSAVHTQLAALLASRNPYENVNGIGGMGAGSGVVEEDAVGEMVS